MVHDGSNVGGKAKRQTALTMQAHIDPAKFATEDEIKEGANTALERMGLTVTRCGKAKTELGCSMTKFYLDLDEKPRIYYDHLHLLYDGALIPPRAST